VIPSTDVAWKADAKCRGIAPALFFPERGGESRAAQEICASCPVKEPCAAAGLWETHGIWGGTTEHQRRVIRRSVKSDVA